ASDERMPAETGEKRIAARIWPRAPPTADCRAAASALWKARVFRRRSGGVRVGCGTFGRFFLGALGMQVILQRPDEFARALAGEGGDREHRAVPAQLGAEPLAKARGVIQHVELVEHQPAGLFVQ